MKRSDKRTGYILIDADTNSEWDSVRFAILAITDGWLQTLKARWDRFQLFLDDAAFWEHIYFETAVEFYNEPDDWNAEDIFKEGEHWAFVETNEEELEQLPVPETALETPFLVLNRFGNAYFRALGKHTGEEFFTAVLPPLERWCAGIEL